MNRKEKRNKKKELDILKDVVTIINQYFPELIDKFEGLTDLRHQSYVTYRMKVIFIVRLLALMCEIKTMNELTSELNTKEAIENIAHICGLELEEIPHCDTINDVFKNIEVREIEEIIKYMIVKMIRNKMFEKYKIRGQHYHIIVDGTGLATSRKKYNKNCLVKNKTDKNGKEYQEYSTYVLEAKLVIGDMVFSIGSEFVENEEEKVDKQDCEAKAFKRLAKKIKKDYPRLRIIMSGDAEFFAELEDRTGGVFSIEHIFYEEKSVDIVLPQNFFEDYTKERKGELSSVISFCKMVLYVKKNKKQNVEVFLAHRNWFIKEILKLNGIDGFKF